MSQTLDNMVKDLPEDYGECSTFAGVKLDDMSRKQLYAAIKVIASWSNLECLQKVMPERGQVPHVEPEDAPECTDEVCQVVGIRIIHGNTWRCCNCESSGPVILGRAAKAVGD